MVHKIKTPLFEAQQKAKNGGICARCFKTYEILTVDHIIPVTIIDQIDPTGEMKYNWQANFELVCTICNRFKACRVEARNPKTKPLLQQLVDLL